jgi:protein tyrosine phosphatase
MIWETNAMVIIMLANCFENGVAKVAQYWPKELSESIRCGDFKITLTDLEVAKEVTTRRLDILNAKNELRTVVQLHYTAWPGKFSQSKIGK